MSSQTVTLLEELRSAEAALEYVGMALTYAKVDGSLDAEVTARVEEFVEAASDGVDRAIFFLEEVA